MLNKYHPNIFNIYYIDKRDFCIGTTSKTYIIINKEQDSTNYLGESARGKAFTVIEYAYTMLYHFLLFLKTKIFKAPEFLLQFQRTE